MRRLRHPKIQLTAATAARRLVMECLESRVLLSADDQISEAITVALGASVNGTISPATDVDMYRVAVAAGQTVGFDVDLGTSSLDPYIRLFNSSGLQLAVSDDDNAPGESGTTRESYIRYTFSTAGSYYLGVSGYGNSGYNAVTGAGDADGSQGAYTLRVTPNVAPTIGSLSDSPDAVTAPNAVTLTANSVVDSDGSVTSVQFFRETNGASGLQAGSDLLLATDTTSPYTATVDTSTLAAGAYTYYARATDNLGLSSNTVSTTNTVQVINDASITGTVWNDADGDATRDAGESVLAGWTVFLDANRNQVLDSGEVSTKSSGTGAYGFTGLAGAKTYYVTTQIPAGWQQTFPGTGGRIAATTSAVSATATGSADAVVAAAAPEISTTGSTVPLELIESTASTGPDVFPADLESNPLIRLTEFQSDPRFNTIRGQNYSVAVLDTGIDIDHPFFGPDADGNGVSDRIVYQYDFGDNDANASDVSGHGTNVASIVAGEGASAPGMAPGANIIALKVFTDTHEGNFSYVERALQWVVANAAAYNIASINMSLGDSGNYNVATTLSSIGISDELQALAAMNVIVVSAAGNSFFAFNSAPGVSYPAADPNSLAVSAVWDSNSGPVEWADGAIDYTTAPDRIASFSQRSATLTDIFAPGPWSTGGNTTGGTTTQGGTSQSAPHIAGIAALAQQLAMRDLGRRLTMAEFKSLLNSSGVSIHDGDNENDNVTNTNASYRRVDVQALGEAITAMAVSPYTHTVRLAHRQAAGGIDFGNRASGSISGVIFDDYDGDDIQDAAESGRAGVTLYIDANGNDALDAGEMTAVSGAGGSYSFTSVGPGSYSVRQVVSSGYIGPVAERVASLTSGQTLANLNFSEFRVAHAGTTAADEYTIRRDSTGTRIEVTNGSITWSHSVATIDALSTAGITFDLGGGDDTLTIDYTGGSPVPAGGISYIGGTQFSGDRLILAGSAADETFNIAASGITRAGDPNPPSYSNVEALIINGGDGNDTLNYNSAPPAAWSFNGGMNSANTDTLNINAGQHLFDTDASVTTANLQVNVTTAGASVVFNASQHLAGLSLAPGAVATMPLNGNRQLFLKSLAVAPTARLELTNNHLLYDYAADTPYADVRALILNGRDNLTAAGMITFDRGAGDRILALVDNARFGRTSWNGREIDSTTLIGRHTFFGDSNLDGKVTGDDYSAIDANLGRNAGTSQWFHGDFNLDGYVSGDDYVSVDSNLGKGTIDPSAFDAEQAEMTAIHAERYGGKTYIQQVEEASEEQRKPRPAKTHRPPGKLRKELRR